jgi:3-methyladenine DNA glycosylase/8-oxoguanine DNA glycosylase
VVTATFRLHRPLHLGQTLGALRQGRFDPCLRIDGDTAWHASRTPAGPVTLLLRSRPALGELEAAAWGPGAAWALDQVPELVGEGDEMGGFAALAGAHPVVAEAHRLRPGLRITRTRRVGEALLWTICGQKVTGKEARRSYEGIVRRWGERAPDPKVVGAPRLCVQPDPERLSTQPAAAFHRLGLERRRAETILRAASAAGRLEEAASLDHEAARYRLRAVAGVGAWSSAEVALVALGDADAVSIGDYHLPNQVSWAFTGERTGDDARMLELLEPFRPHRGRVLRLLGAVGGPPRHGPRMPLRGFEHQ